MTPRLLGNSLHPASAVADALALAGEGEQDQAHLAAIREALGLAAT